MIKPTVSVHGWVDPVSGRPTRRSDSAVRLWKYMTGKFGEEDVFFFAIPGIDSPKEALDIGYNMLATKFALEGGYGR